MMSKAYFYLAEAADDRIRIDRDASGYGWFVDATAAHARDTLMYGYLTTGERRMPPYR